MKVMSLIQVLGVSVGVANLTLLCVDAFLTPLPGGTPHPIVLGVVFGGALACALALIKRD